MNIIDNSLLKNYNNVVEQNKMLKELINPSIKNIEYKIHKYNINNILTPKSKQYNYLTNKNLTSNNSKINLPKIIDFKDNDISKYDINKTVINESLISSNINYNNINKNKSIDLSYEDIITKLNHIKNYGKLISNNINSNTINNSKAGSKTNLTRLKNFNKYAFINKGHRSISPEVSEEKYVKSQLKKYNLNIDLSINYNSKNLIYNDFQSINYNNANCIYKKSKSNINRKISRSLVKNIKNLDNLKINLNSLNSTTCIPDKELEINEKKKRISVLLDDNLYLDSILQNLLLNKNADDVTKQLENIEETNNLVRKEWCNLKQCYKEQEKVIKDLRKKILTAEDCIAKKNKDIKAINNIDYYKNVDIIKKVLLEKEENIINDINDKKQEFKNLIKNNNQEIMLINKNIYKAQMLLNDLNKSIIYYEEESKKPANLNSNLKYKTNTINNALCSKIKVKHLNNKKIRYKLLNKSNQSCLTNYENR